MRKLVLSLLLAVSITGLYAQKLDDVKEKIQKGKFGEAKEKIDKVLADPKNAASADAYFYKSQIYYNLSKTDPAALAEAMGAMKKYMELEQSKEEKTRMLLAMFESNATFTNIYTDYFKMGVKNFQDKQYDAALTSFRSALEAFDLLGKYKIIDVKFDTTSTIYAGYSAQNAKRYEDAATYYNKLIENKINDTSYVDAYRFMVNYNLETTKDTSAALRYLEISENTFPMYEDLWVDYEMLVMGNDRARKIARYEALSKRYPKNYVVAINNAVELYNATFFGDAKTAAYPAQQEASRIALERALSVDPMSSHANYIMSQFYVNQIYDIEDSVRAVKGTTPADLAKKKEMNARLAVKYENLYTYTQKAFDIFSAQEGTLKAQDKGNYRRVVNQMIDYYTFKKQNDKVTFYQDKLKSMK